MPDSPSDSAGHRRWWILAVLCLGALLVVVANMGLNVALPSLGHDLDAGTTSLAWIVDSYVLCFAGLLLPAGALGDRFGRKATLQLGLLIFLAAAVLGAYSRHTWQLITARAVMGVGAALVTPGTLSILTHVFPPAERARAIGIWAAAAGGSVAISLTWSGLMLQHFWWGSIFLGMAGVAGLSLIAGHFVLPESKPPGSARLDPAGAVFSIVGVTGLLYGFIQAPDYGWTSTRVLTGFVAGVAGLAVFGAIESRSAHPMLDPRFFRRRGFSAGSLSIAAAYFALFGMYFLLTQYLQFVRGYPPLPAGLCALPAGLAQFVIATAGKPLVARYGIRTVLAGGLVASTAGLLVLATSGTTTSPWTLEIGLALTGAGIGLTMPPATEAIMSSLPPERAGVGSAVNNLVRELGGAFGIGLLGSITLLCYQRQLTDRVGRPPGSAGEGLAQAFAAGGGADSTIGAAARQAYTAGLDLAMIAGAAVVLLCAIAAYFAVPRKEFAPVTSPAGS
ncbi:MFS transporter [Amycolatopsis pigmentata]|uniref:MFS transporter n=1 Tax=Amycolatopsis pigmentata TaxID=450801 RepID=A0ABW5FWE3_9PSEU